MTRSSRVLLAAAVLAAVLCGAAAGATKDIRLDHDASLIVGRPTVVETTSSWPDWYGWAATVPGPDPAVVGGLTNIYADRPVIYLNPSVSATLAALEAGGWRTVTPRDAALSVGALIVEAEHNDLASTDPGLAECATLYSLLPDTVAFFGVPAMVASHLHGRVTNPWLVRLAAAERLIHAGRPAAFHDGPCG